MAAPTGPTVRRMQLGWELKRLRDKGGFTLAQAVDGLAFSTSKLHRVENGVSGLPAVADLRALLDRYGVVDEEDVEFLVGVHRDSLKRGWWAQYRNVLPSGMAMYVGLESGSRTLRVWQPDVVHGLLQTEDYARAMLSTAKPVEETTTEFVERTIELRMERKRALTRRESPLRLWAVLDEAALRRVVGDPEAMCAQYGEIARLARLDNVTVQVLPLGAATYRSSSNFALLRFEDPLPAVVQTDVPEGAVVSDRDVTVWTFCRRFDALQAGASDPAGTPAFLHRLAREMKAS